jgi:hypothetical protein
METIVTARRNSSMERFAAVLFSRDKKLSFYGSRVVYVLYGGLVRAHRRAF